VKEKNPHFLFLMETKMRTEYLQRLRIKFGYEGLFTVDPLGKSGGLALFWKNSRELQIQNFSSRHINATVSLTGSVFSWTLNYFYGHPKQGQRESSWQLLAFLSSLSNQAWICIGDFNEIIDNSEKSGGSFSGGFSDGSIQKYSYWV
jgi:hypothetical protein